MGRVVLGGFERGDVAAAPTMVEKRGETVGMKQTRIPKDILT